MIKRKWLDKPLPLVLLLQVVVVVVVAGGKPAAADETAAAGEAAAGAPATMEASEIVALGPQAQLTVYLPPAEQAKGMAVVICPGGGYGTICTDTEGTPIAASSSPAWHCRSGAAVSAATRPAQSSRR